MLHVFFPFLGHLPFSCVSIIVFVLWNAKVFLRKVFSSYRVPKKWFLLICVPLFSDLTFVWSNIFFSCSTKQNFPQILKRRRRRREVVSDLGLTLTEVRWVFYMLHYCYIMFYINGTAVSPNMQETNQATPHKWLRQKPENKLFFNKVKALYIEENGNLHNSDIICSIPFILETFITRIWKCALLTFSLCVHHIMWNRIEWSRFCNRGSF